MELNIEVVQSGRNNEWVWRVRSSDNRYGDTCLALGSSKSEKLATDKAKAVRDALAPLFTQEYRAESEPPAALALPAQGEGEGERDDFWNAVCAWTWKHRGWSPAKCQADELRAALTTRPTPEARDSEFPEPSAESLAKARIEALTRTAFDSKMAKAAWIIDRARAIDAALALPAQGEGNNA